MVKRIGFVACTKKKKNYSCKAEDLYSESTLFRYASSYCRKSYDDWYILSAQHFLIPPVHKIDPYDKTLVKSSVAEKRDWARVVFEEISEVIPLEHLLYFHAGSDYTKYLVDLLSLHGYRCFQPLKGLSIGKRLQWYKEASHETL